jgi:hypothetical protein
LAERGRGVPPRRRFRLKRFLLVRRLESVSRRPARHPRGGDFLSMIEEAMSITPIVFVLVILLFGLDSAGQVKSARGPHNSQPATRKTIR